MKVKRLEFNPDSPESSERFMLLYQGFLAGGQLHDPRDGAKGMIVIRREARILDKFEGISEALPDRLIGEDRVLRGELMVLEQPEFELLVKYFERAPWTTKISRKIVDVSDWLSSLPLLEEKANGG